MPGFKSFSGFNSDANFRPLPTDWQLIITDVRGSTVAIEAGRYREVNTLGASSIICLQNLFPDLEFPFSFGGDGATIALPDALIENALSELARLQVLAKKQYALELRVGAVPIRFLVQKNRFLEVARYLLPSGRSLAFFRGDGLVLAEAVVKEKETGELNKPLPITDNSPPNLAGLSCRWQPIAAKRDYILTIIIEAQGQNRTQTYEEVWTTLRKIITNEDYHLPENARYESAGQLVRREFKLVGTLLAKSFWLRVMQITFAVLFFRHRFRLFGVDLDPYRSSIPRHTDSKKFDAVLRLVIDVDSEQAEACQKLLATLHEAGKIFYGVHRSSHALMTCFVGNLEEGGHLHFIDGSNGGYALSAKQLKQQKQITARR